MRPAGSARVVVLLLLVALLTGTGGAVGAGTAIAAPPSPTPPPNPSDEQLRSSGDAVAGGAAEVAQLTDRLSALQAEAEDLQIQVAEQHESANQAQDVFTTAQGAAQDAADRADRARIETQAAGSAIDAARARLDDVVANTYQQGLDLGPIGMLTSASGPEDLIDRAQMTDAVAQQQATALDALERARVDKANADSAARQAQDEAEQRQQAAAEAKTAADQALAAAQSASDAQAQRLSQVLAEQTDVQRRLDAAENADAGLRAQRQRFDAWQAEQARLEAERQRAVAAAARARAAQEEAARPTPRSPGSGPRSAAPRRYGSAAAQTVIDRAMGELGVIYAWGGGTARGPSRGIRDGGVADAMGDYKKIGFDCSGLMLYAFAGVGVNLPRYSGNQHAYGDQVPLADKQPGDMLAWARNGRIYHIALYIGNNKMIEAPYSGATVRVTDVRYGGNLLPTVSRVL
ncbi:NlpC/P60 family protein [Pseudonocardia sp.]|uniref:NlpC/P60 family protein n=1 Tax=Pseudonocardia sp. TaxID=60912 RepID=UPI0031FDDB0F